VRAPRARCSFSYAVLLRKPDRKYSKRGFSSYSYETKGRVAEWLHGVRLAAPDEQTKAALDEETLTDAERLRVVHLLITSPERDGGAGITPGLDGWNYVESIFPLHDSKFNRVSRCKTANVGLDPILVSKICCQR
jgi:hypothetical protein